MHQSLNFVPLRLAVAAILILAGLVSGAYATAPVLLASADQEQIDPIVTGANTSDEALKSWEERKTRFEECGLCGKGQEFPGDLPE